LVLPCPPTHGHSPFQSKGIKNPVIDVEGHAGRMAMLLWAAC